MKIERTQKIMEKRFGGKGHLISNSILTANEMGEGIKMFSEITLEKDCSLGYHTHEGESETYFIISGKGIYTDNNDKYEVCAGDVVYCPEGSGHALENIGEQDLKFVAIIINA